LAFEFLVRRPSKIFSDPDFSFIIKFGVWTTTSLFNACLSLSFFGHQDVLQDFNTITLTTMTTTTTTAASSRKRKDFLSSSPLLMIDDPLEFDIVCAKDHFYAKHTGNLLFRDHIEATKQTYRQAKTKQEKKKVTKQFVNHLQSKYGSRFLKRQQGNDAGWVEISELQARDKVSHALRFATRQRQHGNHYGSEDQGDKSTALRPLDSFASSDTTTRSSSSSSGYDKSEMMMLLSPASQNTTPLTLDSILDQIFKRQQQLLHSMQQAKNSDDEILPNMSTSTPPVLDSSSTTKNCPASRHGSFICFQQKVKSSVVDAPALRSVPSDVLFLSSDSLVEHNIALLEPSTTTTTTGSSSSSKQHALLRSSILSIDLNIEDMHQLLSEAAALDFDVHEIHEI
jgi:hypothetical protein